MKRIVILVSGSGSNLQAIIEACQAGYIQAEIVAVISNKPNVFALQRAKNAQIATHVIEHTKYSERALFDMAVANQIADYQPDLIILAGYMRILTPHFIQRFVGKIINIHPSLLPKYPGLHTHQRAIEAGDDRHGATVHFVTQELDGGPIILQAAVPVLANDNQDTLSHRVLNKEHQIYPLTIKWFIDGRLIMRDNQAYLDGKPLPICGCQNVETVR
ncbi:phosphoribosylglycinamide formyltransferase [Candidatus Schmidhempelia bombi]|uniref:Phosphoribosylglycinamide formyltransferase n=1 Tax=Candidatus Schmidhempelia bombi str. Bimp TaxID=1387197 RepID=A0AB94IDQ3_9GAMM|nr:phosphoribosylglycinamide formyltransferase [Candidatus Schmidhempelia bombi str. Bimp]